MSAAAATGLAITNPLVKYRALTATNQLVHDPAQLRLALHLQKLYDRLKDYEPEIEYRARLDQISRAVSNDPTGDDETARVQSPTLSRWRALLAAKEHRDSLALTRKLTSHESALQLTSPRGLMLHGEVGTGKSMLIDLFADCLPNSKKRRWHFNTFMLETFSKLESLRKSRSVARLTAARAATDADEDPSMLWVAKDLIQTSPILFLDEFQMPDRAASKILTNLMTSFFQLGGVLIATSNRMPEELAKAAGMEFPPPSRMESLGWRIGLRRRSSSTDRIFGGQSEFAAFLEVLKARCEVWEMEGGKDYRRIESGVNTPKTREDEWSLDGHDDMQHSVGMAGWPASEPTAEAAADHKPIDDNKKTAKLPVYFDVMDEGTVNQPILDAALSKAMGKAMVSTDLVWEQSTMSVYGRTIEVPRSGNGVSSWTFDELCKSNLGPADYITLASMYHTIVLTNVPVLTWLMKNEARRFITLLDALYECRCKLFISAHAGPDDLFFPEKKDSNSSEDGDSVYSETISEVYQDATAPFRPNILTENPNYAEPDPEPDYTHARLAGLLHSRAAEQTNPDSLEDDPPNKPHKNPFGRSFGRTDAEMERPPVDPDDTRRPRNLGPDFSQTGAFTGEDERFAYKRAQSRLWEMCGSRWWARDEVDWHRPLPQEVRRWEKSADTPAAVVNNKDVDSSEIVMGESLPDDTRPPESFKRPAASTEEHTHGVSSPFRTSREPPPKISWTHIWGTMRWGPRAGAWGKGVDGLKDRGDDKR